jgi:hypothetical protein
MSYGTLRDSWQLSTVLAYLKPAESSNAGSIGTCFLIFQFSYFFCIRFLLDFIEGLVLFTKLFSRCSLFEQIIFPAGQGASFSRSTPFANLLMADNFLQGLAKLLVIQGKKGKALAPCRNKGIGYLHCRCAAQLIFASRGKPGRFWKTY